MVRAPSANSRVKKLLKVLKSLAFFSFASPMLMPYALINILISLVVNQPIFAAANLPTKREIACLGIMYCKAILILSLILFFEDTHFSLIIKTRG